LDEIRKTLLDLGLASAPISFRELTPYGYMFPQLQDDPGALLLEGAETVGKLITLAQTMKESANAPNDSGIPSAYTYFGQFIDHDVTQELRSDRMIPSLDNPELKPFSPADIKSDIQNARTPTLDLDCVYGTTFNGEPVPRLKAELVVGSVSESNSGKRPAGKNNENDVPRLPPSNDPRLDRKALVGDARNDENFIISQLQVAFLRAHRTIVGRGHSFEEARTLLRQHYQWLVIHDYLKRIADNNIVEDILTHGNRVFRPKEFSLFMPFEFSAAAFRFGHSMVRSTYQYNINFLGGNALGLGDLFTPVAFRKTFKGSPRLPETMIIQWELFMDGGLNRSRRIDTSMVEPLSSLTGEDGLPMDGVLASLAARNLLRGYVLRIPVGQQVAWALGFEPLKPTQIQEVARQANLEQVAALGDPEDKKGLLQRTPLWYYILAEAAAGSDDGNSLGPVGSTIVAEVLIGMVRRSEDSILAQPGWKPTLGKKPGVFTLFDFFLLADVWR
jgi:hypothetical protein